MRFPKIATKSVLGSSAFLFETDDCLRLNILIRIFPISFPFLTQDLMKNNSWIGFEPQDYLDVMPDLMCVTDLNGRFFHLLQSGQQESAFLNFSVRIPFGFPICFLYHSVLNLIPICMRLVL